MADSIKSRDDWSPDKLGFGDISRLRKRDLALSYRYQLLRITSQMFEYDGLPDTVERKDIERFLQTGGYCVVRKSEKDGKLYFFGTFTGAHIGGRLNYLYLPATANISNSYLQNIGEEGLNGTNLVIGEDCVVIMNDSYYQGLLPIIDKYANLLAECDLSIRLATINSRSVGVLTGDTSSVQEGLQSYIEDLEEGEKLAFVGTGLVSKGVGSVAYGTKDNSITIKTLTELKSHLFGRFFLDVGISATHNQKREYISEMETGMEENVSLPLVDDMLERREKGFDEVERVFGARITPRLSSAWERVRKDLEQIDEAQDALAEGADTASDESEEGKDDEKTSSDNE